MQKTTWKHSLIGAGLVLLTACTSAVSPIVEPAGPASNELFNLQAKTDRQALQQGHGDPARMAVLLKDPAIADVRLVDMRPELISKTTDSLTVPLGDGSSIHFNRLRINDSQQGMTGWIGAVPSDRKRQFTSPAEVDMDPFNWISLLRDGDQVVGSMRIKGQAYRLEPVGAGQHALVRIDESRLPPEAEPIDLSQGTANDTPIGQGRTSAHSLIRLLVVTTDQSRAKYPDYRLRVAQAVQDANQFMINSKVEITYELAGFMDAQYDETGRNYGAQLTDLQNVSTNLGKAVSKERDALRADLVSMLSTYTDVCGVAYVTATKALGFSSFSCIGATLAHELGHNLGVLHGWNPGDGDQNPLYMHGYRRTAAPALHTIMVTSHGAIPYFSNPRLQYRGVPIGTVERHDAARRFNERREIVENFYPSDIMFTLYEYENYEGASCTVLHSGSTTTYVTSGCGMNWENRVSSAVIRGVRPGSTVKVLSSTLDGPSYVSRTFYGEIKLPQLRYYTAVPGTLGSWRGDSVNDRIHSLFSSAP